MQMIVGFVLTVFGTLGLVVSFTEIKRYGAPRVSVKVAERNMTTTETVALMIVLISIFLGGIYLLIPAPAQDLLR